MPGEENHPYQVRIIGRESLTTSLGSTATNSSLLGDRFNKFSHGNTYQEWKPLSAPPESSDGIHAFIYVYNPNLSRSHNTLISDVAHLSNQCSAPIILVRYSSLSQGWEQVDKSVLDAEIKGIDKSKIVAHIDCNSNNSASLRELREAVTSSLISHQEERTSVVARVQARRERGGCGCTVS